MVTVMNTALATSTTKATKPRKAAAKKVTLPSVDADRTHAAWLVREDKLLLSSLSKNIFDLAKELQREAVCVMNHFREPKVLDALEKIGLAFEFDTGSEEEAEFFGLALAGVPIEAALRWCLGAQSRPTTVELEGMMSTPDFRPAMYMAMDLGVWFSNVEQMDDMRALDEWPVEILQEAVADVIKRFEAPTAYMVIMQCMGEAPAPERPYTWATTNCSAPAPARGYTGRYKTKKTRSRTGRKASAWKPYRRARRARSPSYA